MEINSSAGGEAAALLVKARCVRKVLVDSLREFDMKEEQWEILELLSLAGGLETGEISRRLCLPKASTTRQVDNLIDEACVYRRQDSEDGRKILVFASRKGISALDRANAVIEDRLSVISVDEFV